jgi:glucokinase-like ROK family protein
MGLLSKRVRQDEYRVLEIIFWLGSSSRLQLMQVTGWSKTKVVSLVSELVESGWLIEGQPLDSTGGRRASGLSLNPERGYVLGIDLGATSLDVVLCDLTRTCLDTRSQAIKCIDDSECVLRVIREACESLLQTWSLKEADILAVGVGVPGPVDFATGTLINPPIMPSWNRVSLRDEVQKFLNVPVYVDNDVNVMALGELERQRRGAPDLNADETFIVIKLGTGIGAGIVSHGELHRGADGAAGDIGHISVDPHGPQCHCGNVGCLEAMAGAGALAREATAAAERGESPLLVQLLAQRGSLGTPEIAGAAQVGDAVSNAVIRAAGTRIGQVLAGLTNFFNPRTLYLGGGVSEIGLSLLATIRQNVYARSLALSTRQLGIDHLPDKAMAGMRGACALGLLQTIREEKLL